MIKKQVEDLRIVMGQISYVCGYITANGSTDLGARLRGCNDQLCKVIKELEYLDEQSTESSCY